MDKKLNDRFSRQKMIQKIIKEHTKTNYKYLDPEPDGYIIPEGPTEKTLKISQNYLKSNLPKYNSDNIFDLNLPETAPYTLDYTRNGKYLIIGGEKGNISIMDWRKKNLIIDFEVEKKINDVKFLQNETMFAAAQDDMLNIYDNQGIELHALDFIPSPLFLEYLPYHFLLVSALKNNYIKYLDISMGKIVSEIKTKNGIISCFCQNQQNAVIASGHSNGILNLWTPNFSEPVVKMFAHSNRINSVSIDNDGYTLITCGNEQKMKIWDLRNSYKEIYTYFNPNTVICNTVSQKNLLAIGYGNVIEIWKDYSKSKQKEPYMKHRFSNNKIKSKKMKFINFEDFLGIGTNFGFSQISVPGSAFANFDTFENNRYETKNQRRENEIKNLLEKIPYNMITINTNLINKVDPRSKKVIEKEKEEEDKLKAQKILEKQKKKIKMRLKNKAQHDKILKDFERNQKLRSKLKAMIELQDNKKNKEKSIIKNEVKIIKNFIDDFDPELYVQEKEKIEEDEDEMEENEENSK